MDLKRYLSEAELALTQPSVGDEFDISINETFNLETEVLESNEDGITLAMDDRGMSMLEELGALEEMHDKSHGGPYDRGSADAYYGRPSRPHKMVPYTGPNAVQGQMEKVELTDPAEIAAYKAGYAEEDDRKDYGESTTKDNLDENPFNQRLQKAPGSEMLPPPPRGSVPQHGLKFREGDIVVPHTGPHAGVPHRVITARSQTVSIDPMVSVKDHKYDNVTIRARHQDLSPYKKSVKESVNEDIVQHKTHGAVYGQDGKAKLFMTRNEAEEVADAMAKKHGGSGISIMRGPFTGYMVKMPESQLGEDNDKKEGELFDEAVDKAHAERKLRNKYLGGNPKVTFHRGYAKVAAAGKEYHHKIHKGQVEDDPYIIADESISEAEYQGRQVKLGKPMSGDVKKYKVYVRAPNGNIKKVNFGDKNMEIKRDNPARRKNFRARHNCSDKKDRTKAGYWSCRMWSKKPVSKIV